ncbi:MAG: M4 family metallopeptidase [Acidobacteriota bacterium]
MRKKILFVILGMFILLFIGYFLFAPEGKEEKAARLAAGKEISSTEENLPALSQFVEKEIKNGNLRLTSRERDIDTNVFHERYDQYYKGIKVWGAQVLRHKRDGEIYAINGRYYENIDIDVTPKINETKAIKIAQDDLNINSNRIKPNGELVIFPEEKAFYLTFKIILEDFGLKFVYFIDAKTGEIVNKYNDIQDQAYIGLGTGTWNDSKKFSAYFTSNAYYPDDRLRPARIITYDMKHGYYYGYWVTTSDNKWTDGALVDAHVYAGWTYDYYYKVHGRKSINNNNMTMVSFVHYRSGYNNAFWDGYEMVYGDGDGIYYKNFSSALDVVVHEMTHGVTDYSSDLIYQYEPGALNEAFSDIMGVCAEFYHQSEGYGRLKADWWEGEDLFVYFGSAFRYFDEPWRASWYYGEYPDHYSRRYTGSADNGGVHINSSIANHCFYLLAKGGTNRTSGISVSGIGRDKAEKIFYRAFVQYLWPSANFSNARWATVQASVDLYGAASTERQRVEQVWTAVGVY